MGNIEELSDVLKAKSLKTGKPKGNLQAKSLQMTKDKDKKENSQ